MKSRILLLVRILVVFQACGLLLGCRSGTHYKGVLQGAEVKRENTKAALQKMSIEQLHQRLSRESERGLEPFNSMTFREVVSRGDAAAAGLVPLLTVQGKSSLLSLLALRKISPKSYGMLSNQFRLTVLADALQNSKYFNTWGLPHVKWEEAAMAIVEEGKAAAQALKPLLTVQRQAPVWGSEDYIEYRRYQYRVCDYAMVLTYQAMGESVTIPVTPADRDKLIEALLRK